MSKFHDIFLHKDYKLKLQRQELFLAPYMIICSFVLGFCFIVMGALNVINGGVFWKTLLYVCPTAFFIASIVLIKKNKVKTAAYLMTIGVLFGDLVVLMVLSDKEVPEIILFRYLAFLLASLVFNEAANLSRGQGILCYVVQAILFSCEFAYCLMNFPERKGSVILVSVIGYVGLITCHTIILFLNRMKRDTSSVAYKEAEKAKQSLSVVNNVLGEVQGSLEIGKRLEVRTSNAEAEIGKLEEMYKYLSSGASNLTESSHTILNASQNVKTKADSMKQSVQEQNASISETSAALTQISANLTNMNKIATARRSSMSMIVESMEKQTRLIQQIMKEVSQVQESTAKINEFVNTVNGIAEQTSLLSMNASIEAAHSGEHGKGFSVIAQEIRKLSNETSKNAAAIEEALSHNNELVQNTADRVNDFAKFTRESTVEIKDTAQSIEEILQGIQEMDSGTREVMKAMENIVDECHNTSDMVNNVVQNVAEQTESIYSVNDFSTTLAEQVESIDSMVGNLRSVLHAIKIEGDNSAATSKKISEVINSDK